MGKYAVRKNGRIRAGFKDAEAAVRYLADETGHTRETCAEETRGNSKLVDDAGNEWTVTVEEGE